MWKRDALEVAANEIETSFGAWWILTVPTTFLPAPRPFLQESNMKSSWWWAAFAALLAVLQVVQAAVMSIDYGTEWFKVGLIKPGIPLDVALNKDSKRKTQAIVTLRGDERLYGSDALALVILKAS